MSSATTIRIRDLVKSFPAPGGGTTTAVDRVSLTIEAGELFFLLGPSGCGKTTLLRMIAGFIEPTSGSIVFEDSSGSRDVTFVAPNQRNTGMVFQSYALWPHMTIEQNVAFGLDLRKIDAAEKKRRVAEALAVVQMEPYAARRPTQLSGGQQQRVALARALVIRPSVLLLDEPLSNLDAKLRNDLRAEIRRICKQAGLTGIYVTHDQKEALSMADRIAIMRAGQLIQMGTPDGLYRGPKSRFVAEFLGDTNLIPGEVVSTTSNHITIRTSAGLLAAATSSDQADAVKEGSRVLCSIRPEAWKVLAAPTTPPAANTLPGRRVDSTFLGEIAHHTIELAGMTRVRVTELNPRRETAPPNSPTQLSVDASDVVLIPDLD
jgi:iron(III) transport system ATP-binding protein